MDHDADKLELGIRFGCGTLFGVFVGIGTGALAARRFGVPGEVCIAVGIVTALVCGYLAAKHGDEWWERWGG